jgi:hypothetical protein
MKTVSAVASDPAGTDQLTVGAVSLPEGVILFTRGGGVKTVRDGVSATALVRLEFPAVRVHEPVNEVFRGRFRLNSSGFAGCRTSNKRNVVGVSPLCRRDRCSGGRRHRDGSKLIVKPAGVKARRSYWSAIANRIYPDPVGKIKCARYNNLARCRSRARRRGGRRNKEKSYSCSPKNIVAPANCFPHLSLPQIASNKDRTSGSSNRDCRSLEPVLRAIPRRVMIHLDYA